MYSIEGLERGIEAAETNIKTFEDAIAKEKQTIKELQDMMLVVKRKEMEAELAEKAKG